jgi:AraC-binding-like domain
VPVRGGTDVTSMTDIGSRIVEFSTDRIPDKDRIAVWREHYGKVMLRVDIEPARETSFQSRIASLALRDLQILEASSSPVKISRTGRYLADGNDDVVFAINRSGSALVSSNGRERILGHGDAVVLFGGEAASFQRTSAGRSSTLRVPRAMFESTVVSVDDVLMRPITGDRGALRLLADYTSWLMKTGSLIDAQLLNLAVGHVQDLLALTLGPSADFTDTARTRGLRAARLKLAKTYVAAHSHRRDISVGNVASNLNVTPRYVQRLFEADGTTFSEFLTGQRLTRAVRAERQPISDQLYRLRRRVRRFVLLQPALPPEIWNDAA